MTLQESDKVKSINFIFAPLSRTAPKVTAPSTNKVILDYLLHLSIRSRLKQAELDLQEIQSKLPPGQRSEESRQERYATAIQAEQDKDAVESIVAGTQAQQLSHLKTSDMSDDLKQRLFLGQCTNLIFGRFDTKQREKLPHKYDIARHRRHTETIFSYIDPDTASSHVDTALNERLEAFKDPIPTSRCRRHREKDCPCCELALSRIHQRSRRSSSGFSDDTSHGPSAKKRARVDIDLRPPGLIDAIPSFIKTSAMTLRRNLDAPTTPNSVDPNHGSFWMFNKGPVVGGGMPKEWYELFLDLLTQAAIECYLCDGAKGLEPIFEIFSYGDVEEEEENDGEQEAEEEDDEDASGKSQGGDDEEDTRWSVSAADHHLLFPKTRTIFLFSKMLREREKEFLVVNGPLEDHFLKLAQKYPHDRFQAHMCKFVEATMKTLDVPTLLRSEENQSESDLTSRRPSVSASKTPSPTGLKPTSPTTSGSAQTSPNLGPPRAQFRNSSIAPSLLKFPEDPALLIPDVEEVEPTDLERKRKVEDQEAY
ncbi:hypothetical protein BZG36_04620 [Bifiguratus adelaidae]|uniref:Uncharacterized protein n=1 Tax=Bifiguratus adelaidae TaxID=1938954 RepID=A0A261XX71_9FUNG|nr:hypothetical protein BZG36_04620 [Bifiguratus adelaidae]